MRKPYRAPEVEVEEEYYEPPARNRGTLLLFFVLLLVIGWLLFNQTGGFTSIGAGWGGSPVQWGTSDRPVSLEEPNLHRQAGVSLPRSVEPVTTVTPREQTAIQGPVRRQRPEQFRPSVAYARDPNVVAYAWIINNAVNVRTGPGLEYEAFYVLPENWPVAILQDTEVDNQGEVWAHIRVETKQGLKKGWLNRRFLSY
jgi:hypothetical protein